MNNKRPSHRRPESAPKSKVVRLDASALAQVTGGGMVNVIVVPVEVTVPIATQVQLSGFLHPG
jgi:hypothetical protein